MKTCYLIHGIETRNPQRSTISFLKHMLVNFRVKILDYGYFPVIFAPFAMVFNYIAMRKLKKHVRPNSILIGHSNGCTIAYGLSKDVYMHGLVLINPALDPDVEFDPLLKFIHVYWSDKDRVTWLSKFIPFSLWGSMGTTGYIGRDPRVRQWKMGGSHTDIGDAETAVVWGPIIVANLNGEFKD